MTFLTLDHVTHYYFNQKDYTKAIDSISLSIQEGEFVSILGPSGCGKTTILSIIAGILQPTKGEILLHQKSIDRYQLPIGYMLQQDYLFPWKTILENILIGPKLGRKNHASLDQIKKRAHLLLKEVGLPNVADAYPSALSGGMRQRVALVRTLITNPEILLLDEPFSALDYLTRLKLEDLVFDLLHTYEKTAVLVTHDIGEAISMSDRLILMEANPGRIAKIIEIPEELRKERPFLARRHPDYQRIFDQVWEQLNEYEENSRNKGGISS